MKYFGRQLIAWYQTFKRDLPWRTTMDPYIIWVSEIILQQTRVDQGLPYFFQFLEEFPNIRSLANSTERKVLKVWEGLGYYSRARNMLKCAKSIVANHGGHFPRKYDELLLLPGIGKYTAAAIASFAFGESVPAIDGNAIRVITRIFRINEDPQKISGSRLIFEKSLGLMPQSNPGAYNQAIMELGARICKPVKPICRQCPVREFCGACFHKDQDSYPYKKAKAKIRKRHFNYVILKSGNKIYLQLRNNQDIWKGLYEFLLIESDKSLDVEEILEQVPLDLPGDSKIEYESPVYSHQLSHQEIKARFIEIYSEGISGKMIGRGKMYSKAAVKMLPKSVLINKYLAGRLI